MSGIARILYNHQSQMIAWMSKETCSSSLRSGIVYTITTRDEGDNNPGIGRGRFATGRDAGMEVMPVVEGIAQGGKECSLGLQSV
jgi:hypothetical protein